MNRLYRVFSCDSVSSVLLGTYKTLSSAKNIVFVCGSKFTTPQYYVIEVCDSNGKVIKRHYSRVSVFYPCGFAFPQHQFFLDYGRVVGHDSYFKEVK